MRNRLLFVVCSALFVMESFSMAIRAEELSDRFEKAQFTGSANQTLLYRFLRPKNFEAGQKYPLVLFLHGAGERGDDNNKPLIHGVKTFAKDEFLTKFPCFVVAPQCPENQMWTNIEWSTPKVEYPEKMTVAMTLVFQCLDSLEKQLPIDTDREYVTGLSMGGFGAWDAICRQPNRFAAAVPVCGGCDLNNAKRIAHVPVWAFHGANDQVVKVERTREIVDALKVAGGSPKYIEYPSVGHDSWNGAYKDNDMYAWLFKQRKK